MQATKVHLFLHLLNETLLMHTKVSRRSEKIIIIYGFLGASDIL